MFGTAFKTMNVTMNLLPYALLIWGFYTMIWGISTSRDSFSFYHFVDEMTCRDMTVADNYLRDCESDLPDSKGDYNYFHWDMNIQVTNLTAAKDFYNESLLAYVVTWSLFCVAWIGIYLKNSGVFSQSWGTIGYHALNVKTMRMPFYKYFGYLLTFFLSCLTIYGFQAIFGHNAGENATEEEEDAARVQREMMATTFANGMFQCILALVTLMTPVPDTVKYGEKLMKCKIKCQPWQTSRAVMELFQDAVAAARGGDAGYLKEITGCSDEEVHGLLSDVTAIPFELSFFTKVTKMIQCQGGDENDKKVVEMEGGDDVEA